MRLLEVWYLPCKDTPFLNRTHPVFLAIKDWVIDCEETRIRLEHFGWVNVASCFKLQAMAEEELFLAFEDAWGNDMPVQPPRSSLSDYYQHIGKTDVVLPWFDLYGIIN